MNLSRELLPDGVFWLANGMYAALLGRALLTAPWRRLVASRQSHVFLGASVFLLLLWSLRAGIDPGLSFHLLGGTLLLLMFGWQLALVAVSLVIAGMTLNGVGDWQSFAINALVMGAIPILLSLWVYRLAVQFLPHHFFVYVMVDAYFCAALAMAVTVAAASLLLVGFSSYSLQHLTDKFLPFVPFMMFGEAFFTGMLAAGMALMRPEWIWSFDDRRYLAGK